MGLPTMRDSMDAVRAAERARGGTPRTLGVTGASGESARRAVAAGDASREAARRSSLNSHQGAAASHEAAAASYKAEGNHARAQHHADTAARHRMAVREFSRIVPTHSPAAAPAGTTAARLSNRGTESAASSRKLGTARELQASPGSGSLESRRTQAMHQGHHDEHDRRSKAERSSPAARRNLEDAFTTEKRYAQGASDHANRDGTALAHTRAAAAHREAGEAASRAGYSPAQHYARAREHDEEASAAAVAHAVRENRAVQATQHGTATTHTPHDQAMHRATQTGAKGGKFVISATGKKRYVKR